jgi:hypothetical protein
MLAKAPFCSKNEQGSTKALENEQTEQQTIDCSVVIYA